MVKIRKLVNSNIICSVTYLKFDFPELAVKMGKYAFMALFLPVMFQNELLTNDKLLTNDIFQGAL